MPSTQPELDAYLANGERWRPSSEFHGSPGRDGSGPDNRVVFNELLSNPGLAALDWFELYNTTLSTVDLGGWFISDDSSEYKKFEIPALTLEEGMVLFYDESDFNSGGNLVDFSLAGAKGDDLYLIQPGEYKAKVAAEKATVEQVNVALTRAEIELNRQQNMLKENATSQSSVDTAQAERDGTAAQLEAAKAALELAELDLEYTSITAPIDGRVERTLVRAGNLVEDGEATHLTTVMKYDPMESVRNP